MTVTLPNVNRQVRLASRPVGLTRKTPWPSRLPSGHDRHKAARPFDSSARRPQKRPSNPISVAHAVALSFFST